MKNLEQIRAARALKFFRETASKGVWGDDKGQVISKIPALIIRDGLLASLAFCKSKGGGHQDLAKELCEHLFSADLKILRSPGFRQGDAPLDPYIQGLSEDSAHLRIATAEALAYLAYLKRFQPKEKSS